MSSWQHSKIPAKKKPTTQRAVDTMRKVYADNLVVVGIDEAGWGPAAGPLVAAAVMLPRGITVPPFIKDSKKLSEKRREEAYLWIYQYATFVSVCFVEASVFSLQGAAAARESIFETLASQVRAVYPDSVIVIDGTYVPPRVHNMVALIKGDQFCTDISAASILAKVSRDRHMVSLVPTYPEFGWETNKGYLTMDHLEALRTFGATPQHRFNIRKVREVGLYGKAKVSV